MYGQNLKRWKYIITCRKAKCTLAHSIIVYIILIYTLRAQHTRTNYTAINIKSRIPLFISVAPTLPGCSALLHALVHILYKFPIAFLRCRVRGQFLEILYTHTHTHTETYTRAAHELEYFSAFFV